MFVVGNWHLTMRNGDSSGYYLHAVSAFVNQDVGSYDQTLEDFKTAFPLAAGLLDDPYWIRETEIGRKSIKYPVGIALMELPAFVVAHGFAKLNSNFNDDGWSKPYLFAINFIQILYLSIGFYLLYLVLVPIFDTAVTVIALLSLALGTNLLVQASHLTIAHTFQFFNFSLLIYLTWKFYSKPTAWRAFFIGLTVGLITICRVPELIAIVVPLTWGVYNLETAKQRLSFINRNWKYVLVALCGLLLMLSPQFAYWKYVSGQFIFNSYSGENIDFTKPRILKGWFSYKNGWLIYTPLMAFALMGILFLKKDLRRFILPVFLFLALSSYIHYSYYQWNYFPGIGSRPMIDAYPLLSIPLAAFLSWVVKRKLVRILVYALLVFFIGLNIFQTGQYVKGVLAPQEASKAHYWEVFGKWNASIAGLKAMDSQERQPKDASLKFKKHLESSNWQLTKDKNATDTLTRTGAITLRVKGEYPDGLRRFSFKETGIKKGDYVKVRCWAYVPANQMRGFTYHQAKLVVVIKDQFGKNLKWKGLPIQRYIKNDNPLAWSNGKPNVWDEVSFFVRVPKRSNDESQLEVMIWNSTNQELFLDDLRIELWEE